MKRILALCFFGFLVSGCSSLAKQLIQEPKVELTGVSLRDIKTSGGTILLAVQVENPNAFALKLDALKYDLELGGKKLSTGQLDKPAEVAGNAKTIVEIPVPVKFDQLFASMMDFLSKSSSAYRVTGEARFGLITLPFDKSGEMKLK